MPDLKLAKLPDRTPVKHAIIVMPELEQKLKYYADLYRQSYGEVESIEVLIPYMLDAFLEGDRSFAKARQKRVLTDGGIEVNKIPRRERSRGHSVNILTPKEE